MPCNHVWEKIVNVRICMKCGITKLPNGQIFFDRKYIKKPKTNKRIKKVKKYG